MDKDVLIHELTERFRAALGQGLEAVENAPDGKWIAASEWAFVEAFRGLTKDCYEAALQAKINADPAAQQAAFSPSRPSGPRSAASAP